MAKPLTIRVDQRCPDLIIALQAKGHTVVPFPNEGADLILGPTCVRFLPGMEFALDSLIKGARKVKDLGEKG